MDGDYQTWHLHNKVPGILNVIDLLSTSRDACLPVVSLNSGYLARAFPFSFRSLALKKNQAPLFLCLIGRAVCDGREADLYETPARQPLHAGPGLFKDLFIRALPLHDL